ncbi:tRNA pseudouridine(38-40) synthase TruA [Niameybacter massiliensis]|uniref:tRNA pseudouridine(38-40) synthase TruA n=1 Tax=Niameybacter massiliensis TaxID=1658108 RepID=UPI0006B62F81|nr:tRNA pseudouridine(38-40) synthase TruA [Niameybacter massiliensis]
MRRVQLIVAYDGTNFHGFAKQNHAATIQGTIEKALYELTKEKIDLVGSGRTDAGVHAKGQCCIIDTNTTIPTKNLVKALNGRLPKSIVIKDAMDVKEDFHPRFMAKRKTYRYQILTSSVNDPFVGPFSYFYPYPLDIERMQKAAKYIEGEHDFKGFCASGSSVKGTVRTVYSIEVRKVDDLIQIDICGNGFLYNMVRIIAGTLIEVGRGKKAPRCIAEMIEKKDRTLGGPTAPPEGLTLLEVYYDDALRYE